eukprot:5959413-Amphidinium_carterae.1
MPSAVATRPYVLVIHMIPSMQNQDVWNGPSLVPWVDITVASKDHGRNTRMPHTDFLQWIFRGVEMNRHDFRVCVAIRVMPRPSWRISTTPPPCLMRAPSTLLGVYRASVSKH